METVVCVCVCVCVCGRSLWEESRRLPRPRRNEDCAMWPGNALGMGSYRTSNSHITATKTWHTGRPHAGLQLTAGEHS